MDKQERDKLRELCEEATPGPWETKQGFIFVSDCVYIQHHKYPLINTVATASNADAEFIAACRDAVPALLDYIEVLERALELCANLTSNKQDNISLCKDLARKELNL